jgi:ATP-dependent Lhr-like helicase
LADHDILMQSADGTLLHAPKGEQIVNHYSFYTAFWAPEEFKLFHGTNLLGTLPVTQPIPEKSLLLFGGRRWRVLQVDEAAKLIEVVPAQGGRAPLFSGGSGRVHGRIHEEMCRLYQGDDFPIFLDEGAKTLLKEGREQFRRSGLNNSFFIPFDGDTLVFLWAGDLAADTILVQLQSQGHTGLSFGVGLLIEKIQPIELRAIFEKLVRDGPPDPIVLADSVPNRQVDRYDALLPDDLLSQNYASGELDTALAWRALAKVVGEPRL